MCVVFFGGVCVVFVQRQRNSRRCVFGSVMFFLPPWLLCVCVWGTQLPSSTQGFEWQPSRKRARTVFHSPSAWCGWACVPFPRDKKKLAHLQLTAAQYLASLEHLCAVCAAFAMVPCVPCLPCLLCLLCLPCFSSGMVSCGACVFVSTRYAARRKMFQDIVFQNYARVAVPCVPPSSAPAGATCDLCAVCRM